MSRYSAGSAPSWIGAPLCMLRRALCCPWCGSEDLVLDVAKIRRTEYRGVIQPDFSIEMQDVPIIEHKQVFRCEGCGEETFCPIPVDRIVPI